MDLKQYNIIRLSDVASTNDYALSLRFDKVFKEGLVIVAGYQIKGKGQRGNNWVSVKGKNILVSVVIEPRISIQEQFEISKIAGLSLVDCLLNLGLEAKIKWPNDILVGKKKIAGILIQNLISDNIITHSVIGIGLNVNQLVFDDFTLKATSLQLELDKDFILEEIQNKLLRSIEARVVAYRSAGVELLEADYLQALFQKDKIAVFESQSQKFNGIIRGVSDRGLLIIEIDNMVKEFGLKEVKMLF